MNRPFYPAVILSLTHLVDCFYSFQPSLGHKNDRQRQKNSRKKIGDVNLFVQLSSAESLEANVIWWKKYRIWSQRTWQWISSFLWIFFDFGWLIIFLSPHKAEWLPRQMLLWDVNWGAGGTCWVFPSPQEARLPAVCPITAEVQSQPILSDAGGDGVIRNSEVLEMKQRFFLSSAMAQNKN